MNNKIYLWEEKVPYFNEAYNQEPPSITEYFLDNGKKNGFVLVIPGGGYGFVCVDHEGDAICRYLNDNGISAAYLNYRIEPYRHPVMETDARRAIRLVRYNADKWGIDSEKIGTIGFSAGGHLAAHYSNAYAWPEVRELFPESKPVNASVLCYPVITADLKNAHYNSFQNLLGKETLTAEEKLRFSCNNMVTSQTPPTFLWHTRQDQVVPVMNSLLYGQALAEHGVPFAMHIYPEGVHGLSTVDSVTNNELRPAVMLAKEWLEAVQKCLSFTF